MKNKFIKNIFVINLFLIFTSIYIPSFLMSILILSLENKFISSNNIQDPIKLNSKEKLLKKIETVKNGYLPFYHPCQTKKYFRKLDTYPIGSLPYTNTYYCDEGYGLIKYKTDRFGLRNRDSQWNKISSQNNIFLVGDSFVQGACVPDKWTISNQISNLSNINTLNLGSSCNCPYEYIVMLDFLLKPIISNSEKSNKIILTFYDNDNISQNRIDNKHIKELINMIDTSSIDLNIPTKKYQDSIDRIIKENYATTSSEIIKELNNKESKALNRNWKDTFLYKSSSLFPIRERLNKIFFKSPTYKSIELLAQICTEKCQPYVAYIPNSANWRPNKESISYKNKLKNYSKKMNINFIDGEAVIDPYSLDDYSPNGPHLSKSGYKKFSEYLVKSLKQIK